MTLSPGTKLGAYEVIALLGEGGMGEVYRARDPRLGRDVAIKVLPAAFVRDPERLARFEREARLLAVMSHAGIAAIYGVDEAEGRTALVMELVEGHTLAERLESGPLPEAEAIEIARKLAEALEYAHDRGIVHRDLKPANIKIRPDGEVKVLDFGLARALQSEVTEQSGLLSQSPTITNRMTVAGVILGTAAYMSPEQARGRDADRRADIWAFGAVLFEMLSGKRAFGGETLSDTMAAVMRDEPDWSALPAGSSPRWRALMARCLTKDPRARLQAIGEARIILSGTSDESLLSLPRPLPPASSSVMKRPGWLIAAALILGIVLGGAGLALLHPRTPMPAAAATEVSMMLPPGQRFGGDRGFHFFALSPDGRAIACAVVSPSGSEMHLRRLDRREDIALPGTETVRNMFFSPDGEWIGFFNSQALCKVSVHGGSPVVLTSAASDRGGTWLKDGTIVFSSDVTVPLFRMAAAGGKPVAVTVLDTTRAERTHRFPCALDGGPWVVFTVGRRDSPGGYDDSPIDAVNVKTGERRNLVKGARRAIWASPGYLVFDRLGDLYAMPIDPQNPRPGVEPLPVLDGVDGETSSGAGFFEIANDGTLAWLPAESKGNQRDIGWLDREGHWTPTTFPPGSYFNLRLSPDGSRILICAGPGGGAADLWVGDLASGALNRLTYGNTSNPALWLPDGERMVYARSDSTGGTSIVVRRLDGAGGERVLDRKSWPILVTSMTPNGEQVIYCDYGVAQGRMRIANLTGDPSPRELRADSGNERSEQAGVISPDGRWLAYISSRTRREEIYVCAFNGTGSNWQISTKGGGGVRWGRDSRELFFVEQGTERMMRVTLEARGNEIVAGQPQPLFEAPLSPTEPTYRDMDFDAAHDRFLITRPPAGVNERREIALSLGWASRLADTMKKRGGS
jgi:hypothetical protein